MLQLEATSILGVFVPTILHTIRRFAWNSKIVGQDLLKILLSVSILAGGSSGLHC